MEIQRHYIDVNGNHFVAPFTTQELADAYVASVGATEVEPRPTSNHVWIDGQWVLPETEEGQ